MLLSKIFSLKKPCLLIFPIVTIFLVYFLVMKCDANALPSQCFGMIGLGGQINLK